jgi:hypothetical protein
MGARLATNAAQKTMSSRIRAIPASFREEGWVMNPRSSAMRVFSHVKRFTGSEA